MLNRRGERYDADTISERLSVRDMMEEWRSPETKAGGPEAFSQADWHVLGGARWIGCYRGSDKVANGLR